MHPLGLPDSLASERRPLVMSVLNVTPDSFSDGGRYVDVDTAVAHALQQAAAGADIIDVGGESTRPGAGRIPADEELRRVLPVVEQLVGHGLVVSIDTMRAAVARAAVGAGAALVNDVSGGLADPDMRAWVASVDVPYIAMHWRGHSTDMQRLATYVDVVDEVCAELRDRLDELAAAGVDPARVVIDPGLGFAKEPGHNWALLAALPRLVAMGHPVLIGASRKRFLGELLGDPGNPRPVADRDAATDAISALAAANGAWAVRVHDVRGSRDAVAVAAAWRAAGRAEPSAAARTGPPGAAAQTGPGAGAATDPGGATLADPRAHALTDPGSAAPPDPWGERP
jgi:dihydropteroate synthase